MLLYFNKDSHKGREAPWSIYEHRGLTVWAIVLRHGFDPQVHLNNLDKWEVPLDGRKPKIIKTAKRGKSHWKIFKKKITTKGHVNGTNWILLCIIHCSVPPYSSLELDWNVTCICIFMQLACKPGVQAYRATCRNKSGNAKFVILMIQCFLSRVYHTLRSVGMKNEMSMGFRFNFVLVVSACFCSCSYSD